MVVVEHLHERLDLGPLGDLLLAHGGGHFAGVAVDAGHQSVAVGTVGGAVVDVLHTGDRNRVRTRRTASSGGRLYLHDDSFAAGVASSQDHHHLPRLHELAHV